MLLKFPTITMDLYLLIFLSYLEFCFMYFEVLLFGAYTFKTVLSSGWNDPLNHYAVLLLSFVIFFFALMSNLSDISIATPAFFWLACAWYVFFHPFTFKLPVLLYLVRTLWNVFTPFCLEQEICSLYYFCNSSLNLDILSQNLLFQDKKCDC